MASSSASTFTSNVRQFAHEVREIFLDFLKWDEQDDAAAQEANLSALDDPTSKSVQLPDGGWKMVQRKRKPTTIDFPAVQYDTDTLAELLTFDPQNLHMSGNHWNYLQGIYRCIKFLHVIRFIATCTVWMSAATIIAGGTDWACSRLRAFFFQ